MINCLLLDEIRQDIEDAVLRLKPWKAEDGSCYFGGWARMALPIQAFSVVEVKHKKLFVFLKCYMYMKLPWHYLFIICVRLTYNFLQINKLILAKRSNYKY